MAGIPVDLPYPNVGRARLRRKPWMIIFFQRWSQECLPSHTVPQHVSLKQWDLPSLLLNLENGRSGTMWLLRLGHKRQIRLTWCSWDACSWNPAKQPQGEDPWQCSGQQLQQRSQQPLAPVTIHVSQWACRWFQAPEPQILSSCGPRHCIAEKSHPCCALSDSWPTEYHECSGKFRVVCFMAIVTRTEANLK